MGDELGRFVGTAIGLTPAIPRLVGDIVGSGTPIGDVGISIVGESDGMDVGLAVGFAVRESCGEVVGS
jgi:hypothetical protein